MTDQPMPTPGQTDVTPIARELFAELLGDQVAKGLATYGTPLQTFNGRNAVLDALHECIDLFQYLVQARIEHEQRARRIDELNRNLAECDREIAQLRAEMALKAETP